MTRRPSAALRHGLILLLAVLFASPVCANPMNDWQKQAPKLLAKTYPLLDALPATPPTDPSALAVQAQRFEQLMREFNRARVSALRCPRTSRRTFSSRSAAGPSCPAAPPPRRSSATPAR